MNSFVVGFGATVWITAQMFAGDCGEQKLVP